ncbi:MAG: outer membrane protein assembly factor BamA [Nitrospirae bacterium]|nr:outer membrane protein assembly factor BamA [Nitrospirota bacterium]
MENLYRKLIIINLTGLILFVLCSIAFAEGPPQVIRAIEVEGLTRIPEKELIDIICFKPGLVFEGKALKDGLRRAFAKGIFYDLEVVSSSREDGIALKYIVKEVPLIDKVIIEGNSGISGKDIRKMVPYKEGGDFREEYLDGARNSLLVLYGRKGFPDASVSVGAGRAGEGPEVDILIRIDEGRPLIIRTIEAPDDVKRTIRLSEGDILDMDILDADMKKVEEYLRKQDYINPQAGPYEFSDGVLMVPVRKGPRLEMSFAGNSSVSAKRLRKEVPFFDSREVSDETIQEAIDRMRGVYLSSGYYHAQIAAGIESEGEDIKVAFIFFEGKKVILKKINFEGTGLSDEVLKNIIPLTEDKPYDDTQLEAAGESIVRFYNALGYLRAEVTGVEKKFTEEGGGLELTVRISEGPHTTIKKTDISGNAAISDAEIRDAIQLPDETAYNIVDIGDARYRVLSLYGRRGHIDARVEVESELREDGAYLSFKITEGPPSVFGKTIYRGNLRTKTKIIDREFTVKEGDTYNYEELLAIKQRLYRLGLFSEVDIDSLQPRDAGGGRLVRDILVTLREANAGSVEVSVGYGDYERFRGALDINYRNIGGYNRQAGFRAEASSVEKRYVLSFREPRLLNTPDLPLTVTLTRENKRPVNIDTKNVLYEIDRLGLVVGVEKEISDRWKTALNYEYSSVETTNVSPGVVLDREDTGRLGIGSVSPSIFYDTRDDPFDPASGSLHGIVLKVASKTLFSESEFIKGTAQSSWYFKLLEKVVFAFSLRGGAAYGYGDVKVLPLVERFFLGGRTTVRGYNNDSLGPRGADNSPTGGNIFALTNGEVRFSVGKGFGLVTFVDAGNVWQLPEDVNWDLKYTTGLGLRYGTPVGPIRVDYGHKLRKEEGESSGEVHFSFGHAF